MNEIRHLISDGAANGAKVGHCHRKILIHHWTPVACVTPLLTIPTPVSQQGPLTTSAGSAFGGGTSVVLKWEL